MPFLKKMRTKDFLGVIVECFKKIVALVIVVSLVFLLRKLSPYCRETNLMIGDISSNLYVTQESDTLTLSGEWHNLGKYIGDVEEDAHTLWMYLNPGFNFMDTHFETMALRVDNKQKLKKIAFSTTGTREEINDQKEKLAHYLYDNYKPNRLIKRYKWRRNYIFNKEQGIYLEYRMRRMNNSDDNKNKYSLILTIYKDSFIKRFWHWFTWPEIRLYDFLGRFYWLTWFF